MNRVNRILREQNKSYFLFPEKGPYTSAMGRSTSLSRSEDTWQLLGQLIPGILLGAGIALGLHSALIGQMVSPLVVVLIAAGCLPILVEWSRRPLGGSSATLHLQANHRKRLHAGTPHPPVRVGFASLRQLRQSRQWPMFAFVLACSIVAALYAWIVSSYIAAGSAGQLVAQLAPFAIMLYLLRKWDCTATITAVLIGVLTVSFTLGNAVSGITAVALVLGFTLERSLRTNNLYHLPLVVGGSYLAYIYWLWSAASAGVSLLIMQVLLVTYLAVLTPFVLRRRALEERAGAQLVLGINNLGFTLFSCLALASLGSLSEAHPSWVLMVTLSVSVAAAAIAWTVHKEFSYAKYHLLAGILSILVTLSLLLPASSLVADLWLVTAVGCLFAGQYLLSRSLRVASVVCATIAAAFWLGAQVAGEEATTAAWTGLLVVAVLLLCAVPPQHHPRLRWVGHRGEENLVVHLILLAAALLGFGTLTSVLGLLG